MHRRSATALPGIHPTSSLIGYGFSSAGPVFALVAQGLALDSVQGQFSLPRKCKRQLAPMISSRSFFRFNSISAILCSNVLCSSGMCSFLSESLYCREVDSLLTKSPVARTPHAFLGMIARTVMVIEGRPPGFRPNSFSVVTIAYDSSSSSLWSVSEPSFCIFRSTSVMSSTSSQTSRLTKIGADC